MWGMVSGNCPTMGWQGRQFSDHKPTSTANATGTSAIIRMKNTNATMVASQLTTLANVPG